MSEIDIVSPFEMSLFDAIDRPTAVAFSFSQTAISLSFMPKNFSASATALAKAFNSDGSADN